MADKKFSELDPVGSLTGTEILPVIKEGLPKRTTVADVVANYVLKSGDTMTGQLVAPSYDVSGAKILSSTGFPEGVVTAPVGSIYIDKAITNGASSWIKKSGTGNTGWQVLEGDTGWRKVTGDVGTISLKLRRVGNVVYFRISGANSATVTNGMTIATVPSGFIVAIYHEANYSENGGTGRKMIDCGESVRLWNSPIASATISAYTSYPTNNAWPTTLPGTAIA